MSTCESILTPPRRFSADELRILKPGETDPDYLCQLDEQGNWHYRLAIDDLLQEVLQSGDEEAIHDSYRDYLAKPLWRYRPLPQARKFHRSTKRYRWALGGNRSSKTRSVSVDCMWRALGQHPFRPDIKAPRLIWYVATTWKKVGESLWAENLKHLTQGFNPRIVWHNRGDDIPEKLIIPVPAGESIIQFKCLEQKREEFQSNEVDDIYFDEQFPEDIYDEAISRIGSRSIAETAASLTPLKGQPWLQRRLTRRTNPHDAVFEYPLDDNRISVGGFIPDQYIDSLIEQWSPAVRDTRRLGKWGSYIGAIYGTFNFDIHVVTEEKEKKRFWRGDRMPSDIISYGGIDWGGNNPFVFLWIAKIPHLDNDYYVYDELYWKFQERGPRRLEEQAAEIKERSKAWGHESFERIWADWDPTDAYELSQYGVPSQPADKDKRGGIEWMQMLLNPRKHLADADWPQGRPRIHIAERCKMLIEEFPAYHWKKAANPDLRDPKDEPEDVFNHAIDACRYAIFSERPYEDGGQVPIGSLGQNFRNTF